MKLILSTLSAPQSVSITGKTDNGALVILKEIHLNGGANVADRHTLLTPQGVITELSDADYEALIKTAFYKRMNKRGHLRPVETKEQAEDTKKAGMKKKDLSAQKTEADFETGKAPVVGKGEE